jgi:hypothetical protein
VVDIGPTFQTKLACLKSCKTMVTHMVRDLNDSLAERKLRLPALSGNVDAAIDEYARVSLETHDRAVGRKYGLDYAEEFHYIGPDNSLEDYISRNAVPL